MILELRWSVVIECLPVRIAKGSPRDLVSHSNGDLVQLMRDLCISPSSRHLQDYHGKSNRNKPKPLELLAAAAQTNTLAALTPP